MIENKGMLRFASDCSLCAHDDDLHHHPRWIADAKVICIVILKVETMSYQLSWVIPHRVFWLRQEAEVTLEQIRGFTREIADYIEVANRNTPDAALIGIIDMREADFSSLLRSALSLIVNQISEVVDPRIWKAKPGFVTLIINSERGQLAISLVIKISAQPMTTVATFDEALTIIGAMYPELEATLTTYKEHHLSADTTP